MFAVFHQQICSKTVFYFYSRRLP